MKLFLLCLSMHCTLLTSSSLWTAEKDLQNFAVKNIKQMAQIEFKHDISSPIDRKDNQPKPDEDDDLGDELRVPKQALLEVSKEQRKKPQIFHNQRLFRSICDYDDNAKVMFGHREGTNIDAARGALEAKADINSTLPDDLNYRTPLHYAAQLLRPNMVTWILKNNGKIDAETDCGATALHCVIKGEYDYRTQHPEHNADAKKQAEAIVRALIEHKINPSILSFHSVQDLDDLGYTALELAEIYRKRGHDNNYLITLLESLKPIAA